MTDACYCGRKVQREGNGRCNDRLVRASPSTRAEGSVERMTPEQRAQTSQEATQVTDATRSQRSERRQSARLAGFRQKLSEDWIFNFSGMLAFNYLTVIAPILLGLLATGGVVLGFLAPATYHTFVQGIAQRLPGGQGLALVHAEATTIRQSASALFLIALIAAILAGSRFFVALEKVFAVLYRVEERPFSTRNIIAVLMLLLFLLLAPLCFFAGGIPAIALSFVLPVEAQRTGVTLTIEAFSGAIIAAFIMFAVMYAVIPNRAPRWAAIWPGALTAAILLNLYEALFPLYQYFFLHELGYGSVAGLAVIILVFFYFVGFITLLGAEINAWATGLRPLGMSLPQLFRHAGDAHGGMGG